MHESVQELTNKIYQEGIGKAEARAKEILDEAARKARELVDDAETKARQIIDQAEKKATEIRLKNEAEMRLSARQAMGTLKQRIADMIVWQLNHEPVKSAVNDSKFMQNLIGKLLDYWIKNNSQENRLKILLPQDEYQHYRHHLEERTQELMKAGIRIEYTSIMKHGFQIVAEDQGYRISFSDEDFENYFSNFARPRIYKLLFGKEE